MSQGGDGIRSPSHLWPNSGLGAVQERGYYRLFLYTRLPPLGPKPSTSRNIGRTESWAAQERGHHGIKVTQPLSDKEMKEAVKNHSQAQPPPGPFKNLPPPSTLPTLGPASSACVCLQPVTHIGAHLCHVCKSVFRVFVLRQISTLENLT